jgi:uncharacterized membrane protein YbhN (UPF0104 family)
MKFDCRRRVWLRVVPFVVAPILLWFAFRGLKFGQFVQTFGRMRPGWFFSAVALYGLLFLPAAWRWHLVLKLSQKAVSFGATLRSSLIGHFFYTTFFGVVGGDSAKAILYANRFGFSRTAILATAPLDRLLGFGGSLIFALLALVIGAASGGFRHSLSITMQWPIRSLTVLLLVAVIAGVLFKRRAAHASIVRFWFLLREQTRALARSRQTIVKGIACGFVVQVALSGVLAFNLAAVSTGPIAWEKQLWTFPLVIAISALPISIGGLGTREGAALMLWSSYGIANVDALAASLLTLAVALFWAAVAAMLLFVTENDRRATIWRAIWKRDAEVPLNVRAA